MLSQQPLDRWLGEKPYLSWITYSSVKLLHKTNHHRWDQYYKQARGPCLHVYPAGGKETGIQSGGVRLVKRSALECCQAWPLTEAFFRWLGSREPGFHFTWSCPSPSGFCWRQGPLRSPPQLELNPSPQQREESFTLTGLGACFLSALSYLHASQLIWRRVAPCGSRKFAPSQCNTFSAHCSC